MDKATFQFIAANKLCNKNAGFPISATTLDGQCTGVYMSPDMFGDMIKQWVLDMVNKKPLFFSVFGTPENFKLFFDFDIVITAPHVRAVLDADSWRQRLEHVCEIVQMAVCEMFSTLPDDVLTMIVTERPKAEEIKNGVNVITIGIHFHWPHLNVDTHSAAMVRSHVLYQLIVTHKDDALAQPPDPTVGGWVAIIDANVYSGKPHLRPFWMQKTGFVQSVADRFGDQRKIKRRKCAIKDSEHKNIITILDAKCVKLVDEIARMSPLDDNGDIRPDALERIITATCIWPASGSASVREPIPPATFVHGYAMIALKKERRKRKGVFAGDLDSVLDATQLQRFAHALAFTKKICHLDDEDLPPQSEMLFKKESGGSISFPTRSKFCPNNGRDHTSANRRVTVSSSFVILH